MSNQSNLHHDQFKNKINELKDEINVPEPSNWDSVHQHIIKHSQRKKRIKSIRHVSSIAVAALIISLFISGNHNHVSAQFNALVQVIKDEVSILFLGHDSETASISRDINNKFELTFKINDIDLKKLSFDPIFPNYLPEQFSYESSKLVDGEHLAEGQLANFFHLAYSDPHANSIYIDYLKLDQGATNARQTNTEGVKLEQLTIHDTLIIYMEDDYGSKLTYWLTKDNVRISVRSSIEKSELIKVVESML